MAKKAQTYKVVVSDHINDPETRETWYRGTYEGVDEITAVRIESADSEKVKLTKENSEEDGGGKGGSDKK